MAVFSYPLKGESEVSASFADSPSIDAFGRLRVSNPQPLFASQLEYHGKEWSITDWQPWETVTSGATASGVHDSNCSVYDMHVGTASGIYVIRQQHNYNRYQPGISQRVEMTGVMQPKSNVTQRIGYFDNNDGLFFEHNGDELSVVVRTSSSGEVVDNRISQSNWNLDKLDGVGSSRANLDISKTQIYLIDFQWLGVGRVRYGFNIDGEVVYVHEQDHANNTLQLPYMRTANLPLRYEIRNTAESASATMLRQICSSVYAEGAIADETGELAVVSNQASFITVGTTTIRPILNVRPKLTYRGQNNTALAQPINISLFTPGDQPVYWQLILNPTFTGGSHTWVDVSEDSLLQRDVVRTGTSVGITGRVIADGYLAAAEATGNNSIPASEDKGFDRNIALTTSYDFSASDIITLAAVNAGTGSTTVGGSITFREFK